MWEVIYKLCVDPENSARVWGLVGPENLFSHQSMGLLGTKGFICTSKGVCTRNL